MVGIIKKQLCTRFRL